MYIYTYVYQIQGKMFINNVGIAKDSHNYVLEIYFVDYYDGALHYYIIVVLLNDVQLK